MCDVRWNAVWSSWFPVYNGVRHGAIFFAIFMDRLMKKLWRSDLGCHVAGEWLGAFIYADDILLLCPSRPGLQAMINICELFANTNNMKFSTNPNPELSKTKCMVFSKKPKDLINIAPVQLYNTDLPWVPSIKHLGNYLECDSSFRRDMTRKRGIFIGKLHSLQQEFHFVSPQVKVKLYNIYTTSFYGSSLYDIYSSDCNKFFTAYNIAIRMCFNVPRQSHRYVIEKITKCHHPKTFMASRLVKFHSVLLTSQKSSVNLLAKLKEKDRRTVHGNNLANIAKDIDTPIDDLTTDLVKLNMKYFPVPVDQTWRLPFLEELLSARQDSCTIDNFDNNEISQMINHLCTT